MDSFTVGDYNSAGSDGDAVGSRQTSQVVSMLCLVDHEVIDLLVKVSMGDEDVVCLFYVIHCKVLRQDGRLVQPGVQEDGDVPGTKPKRRGAWTLLVSMSIDR